MEQLAAAKLGSMVNPTIPGLRCGRARADILQSHHSPNPKHTKPTPLLFSVLVALGNANRKSGGWDGQNRLVGHVNFRETPRPAE